MTYPAFRNLFQQKFRLALSIGGVALAMMLMLALDALLTGSEEDLTAYIIQSDADVFVAQDGVKNMHMAGSVASRRKHNVSKFQAIPIVLAIVSTTLASAICDVSGQLSVRQEIQQAAQNGVEELNLSNRGLTSLPPEFGQLTQLKKLWLNDNQLEELPPQLGQLTNLTELNLGHNQLTAVPSRIGQLTNLERLWLNDNQLTQIPPELGQLSNLRGFSLRNNRLTELPPELGQLSKLKVLEIAGNRITTVPPEIEGLPDLEIIRQ